MTLSASGARIQGDDYQHLLSWYHSLGLLDPEQGITALEIEASGAGSVDDIVVRRANGADEYYQVKYSVDAKHPIDDRWLTSKPDGKGTSILHKLWASWQQIRTAGATPRMVLYTNRALDISDPALKLCSGRSGCLMPRLGEASPGSEAGKRRAGWAAHLGVSEAEMLEMLEHLELLTGQGPWSHLISCTADRMAARGLQSDARAVEQGCMAARSWVAGGKRTIDASDVVAELERRTLRGGRACATLAVQAIDWLPWAEAATASVDWVELFDGNHARERRQLRDPTMWNEQLWPKLADMERHVRGLGFTRVVVRGHLRLPIWFAVGATFADTRGFEVEYQQGGEVWASDAVPAADYPLRVSQEQLGNGDELAIGLSVTNDLDQDVRAYLNKAGIATGRFVHVAAAQHGKHAFQGAADALRWAMKVREVVREQVRDTGARRVHLFLSGPAGGALFLGFLWNRVPTTHVYEDLNPGYAPTFLIPG